MAKKSTNENAGEAGGALTVYSQDQFLSLAGDGEMAELMEQLRETGMELTPSDIPRIKMPQGGGTRWQVPTPDGESDYVKEITGAFVFMQRSAVLWPSFDPAPGTPPVLRSWDCQTAEILGDVPDEMQEEIANHTMPDGKVEISEASGFAYSQWGSGKDGTGKRIKENRMCFILPPDEPMPFLINVPAGSIKVFDPWFKSLFTRSRIHYTKAFVSFGLQEAKNAGGIQYAQLVPKLAGRIDADTHAALKTQWYEPLSQLAKKIDPAGGDDSPKPGDEEF